MSAHFISVPLFIHNSAKITGRPGCHAVQYSMLVIKSSEIVGRDFYFLKPCVYETRINPLCGDPARQFIVSAAISHCSSKPQLFNSLIL